jgi:hypothetical protein
VRLFGPFPLDLRIPQVGGRAALAAFRGRPTGWVPPEGDRRPPGLYLSLVEEGGAWAGRRSLHLVAPGRGDTGINAKWRSISLRKFLVSRHVVGMAIRWTGLHF